MTDAEKKWEEFIDSILAKWKMEPYWGNAHGIARESREAYKESLRSAIEKRIEELEPNSEMLLSPKANVIRELRATIDLINSVTPKE